MEYSYELVYVLAPDLKDDGVSAAKASIIADMTGLDAVIEKEEDWGKRDLAFEVKDYRQGFYNFVKFKAQPEVPNKIKEILKVDEKVIRYLFTRIEKEMAEVPVEEEKPPEATEVKISEAKVESSSDAEVVKEEAASEGKSAESEETPRTD